VVVDADVVDGSASSDLGPLNVLAGFDAGRARLLVRPEQIQLVGPSRVASSQVSPSRAGLLAGGLLAGGPLAGGPLAGGR